MFPLALLDYRLTLRRFMDVGFSHPFHKPQMLGAGPGFMEILDMSDVSGPTPSIKNDNHSCFDKSMPLGDVHVVNIRNLEYIGVK